MKHYGQCSEDRRRIDSIFCNTKFWGSVTPSYDVAEDMYWLWYDTDEMDANDRDMAYADLEEYCKSEGWM